MSVLTEAKVIWDGNSKSLEKNLNEEIVDRASKGWHLRGIPNVLDARHVLAVFEKEVNEDDCKN